MVSLLILVSWSVMTKLVYGEKQYTGACDYTCQTCFDDSSTSCLTCPDKYSLIQSNNSCSLYAYYYAMFGTNKVSTPGCSYKCGDCFISQLSSCMSCQTGSQRQLNSNSQCQCNQGYFDSGQTICSACDQKCATCSGSSATSCITCVQNQRRTLNYNNGNYSCTCDDGFIDNGSPNCTLNYPKTQENSNNDNILKIGLSAGLGGGLFFIIVVVIIMKKVRFAMFHKTQSKQINIIPNDQTQCYDQTQGYGQNKGFGQNYGFDQNQGFGQNYGNGQPQDYGQSYMIQQNKYAQDLRNVQQLNY